MGHTGVYGVGDTAGVHGVGYNEGVRDESTEGSGVRGETSSNDQGTIEGHNNGLGSGVVGVGRVGVLAFSHTNGWPGADTQPMAMASSETPRRASVSWAIAPVDTGGSSKEARHS